MNMHLAAGSGPPNGAANGKYLVFGAGGFGREVVWLLKEISIENGQCEPAAIVDDDPELVGQQVCGLAVIDIETAHSLYPGAALVVAIGDPVSRSRVVARLSELDFGWPTIVHPSAKHSEYVSFGRGAVICANTVITTQVAVGDFTHVNLGCTIGHDVVIGDYCTISPGVHVSGWVRLGNRVFVGTGAVFTNGTKQQPLIVEDDAVIGAGACVTRPVAGGTTVVGVPARPLEKRG
jgi:sugar O-acyltransferase (sialic acid O-acetyltransferase NeuD family)